MLHTIHTDFCYDRKNLTMQCYCSDFVNNVLIWFDIFQLQFFHIRRCPGVSVSDGEWHICLCKYMFSCYLLQMLVGLSWSEFQLCDLETGALGKTLVSLAMTCTVILRLKNMMSIFCLGHLSNLICQRINVNKDMHKYAFSGTVY